MQDLVRKQFFSSLESLRGIAALCVVFLHFGGRCPTCYFKIFARSYLMVDFFFILSGFIMGFNYCDKIKNKDAFFEFIFLRFARVYPLHFFMLMIFVIAELANVFFMSKYGISLNRDCFLNGNVNAFLLHAFMLQVFGDFENVWAFNNPSWSIGVELYAYLLFALIALFIKKEKTILITALSVVFLSVFIILINGFPNLIFFTNFGIFRCFMGFFLGVCIFCVWKKYNETRFNSFLMSFISTAILFAILVFLLVSKPGYTDYLMPFLCSIFILSLTLRSQNILNSVLCLKPLLWLGKISYSIYMLHWAVIWMMDNLIIRKLNVEIPDFCFYYFPFYSLSYFFIATSLLLMLSHFSYKYIEKPFRIMAKKVCASFHPA